MLGTFSHVYAYAYDYKQDAILGLLYEYSKFKYSMIFSNFVFPKFKVEVTGHYFYLAPTFTPTRRTDFGIQKAVLDLWTLQSTPIPQILVFLGHA